MSSPLTRSSLTLLTALALLCPPVAGATKPRVLVVDFRPGHGATTFFCREVSDALALGLMDTGAYDVIPRSQMEQERALRELPPVVDVDGALRLGRALRADLVATGQVELYVRDDPQGLRLTLRVRLHDVALEFASSGACATAEVTCEPGETRPADELRLQAVSQACKQSVRDIRSHSTASGKVLLVDGRGNLHLNIGTRDGLQRGATVAVIRTELDVRTAQRTVRKIGEAKVTSSGTTDAVAAPTHMTVRAQPLDKVRLVYEYPTAKK